IARPRRPVGALLRAVERRRARPSVVEPPATGRLVPRERALSAGGGVDERVAAASPRWPGAALERALTRVLQRPKPPPLRDGIDASPRPPLLLRECRKCPASASDVLPSPGGRHALRARTRAHRGGTPERPVCVAAIRFCVRCRGASSCSSKQR